MVFKKKKEELELIIQDHNPQIIRLQESNFKENHIAPLKNYKGYSKNRLEAGRASGGTAIYVKAFITSQTINILSDLEVLAVQIETKEKLTICNIYLPNQKKFRKIDIEHIIQQLSTPLILLGDFNAHSPLWGSIKTDPRGKEIETLLENYNIALLNDSTPTHINIANGNFSCIDLTLCSASLAHRIEWKMESKKPKLDTFSEMVDDEVSKLSNSNQSNINEMVNTFTTILIQTAEKTIGSHINQTFKPKVPWWNDEIKEAIKNKKEALSIFKKKTKPKNTLFYSKN
ncbi:hypothetical protein AGLY_011148 [Aphis glycines]|uniref:Endonuclease/exonuclease/phosphatase domain-containing protein n=1 Tax=Aphis glycines TaxID=307491 RepID=A0A6G0TCM1_APHGL|nr:hypothetical protein AGLY_011148 [Aphis glycines]